MHGHFFRSLAFLLGRDRDRRTVHVTPTDHQDLVSFQTMVACKDVWWQVAASHMTKM